MDNEKLYNNIAGAAIGLWIVKELSNNKRHKKRRSIW